MQPSRDEELLNTETPQIDQQTKKCNPFRERLKLYKDLFMQTY